MKFRQRLDFLSRSAAISIIKIYQKTFSFDHGPLSVFFPLGYCKYRPTCSEYAIKAIEAQGLIKGGCLAFYRILRCNPFSKGGNDPV